jgi:hypothetical protein
VLRQGAIVEVEATLTFQPFHSVRQPALSYENTKKL